MTVEGDKLIFRSGRTSTANLAILGISADPNSIREQQEGFSISEGYDSGWWNPDLEPPDWNGDLTEDDLIELAEHMADRWNQFAKAMELRKLKPQEKS